MNFLYSLFAPTLLTFLFAACGSDQEVNSGNPTNPASDSGAPVVIQVTHQTQSVPVNLKTLPTTSYKGTTVVKLSEVWSGSKLPGDRNTLEFEFVSSDGFKPSDKGCAPLSGSVLDKGYINPTSRNVMWDESLGYRGCYSVNDAAKMNATIPMARADAGASDASAE